MLGCTTWYWVVRRSTCSRFKAHDCLKKNNKSATIINNLVLIGTYNFCGPFLFSGANTVLWQWMNHSFTFSIQSLSSGMCVEWKEWRTSRGMTSLKACFIEVISIAPLVFHVIFIWYKFTYVIVLRPSQLTDIWYSRHWAADVRQRLLLECWLSFGEGRWSSQ